MRRLVHYTSNFILFGTVLLTNEHRRRMNTTPRIMNREITYSVITSLRKETSQIKEHHPKNDKL